MLNWLKHAFAVQTPQPVMPTPRQTEVIDRVCQEVVRRGMTTPALVTLETLRPLNFVAAQALRFFEPIIGTLLDAHAYREFAEVLEQRGAVDWLAARIEQLENAADVGDTSTTA